MKIIAEYVDHIDDELDGAKDYSEKYLYQKSLGNTKDANLYREMATDELKHTAYLHDMASNEIKRLRETYQPTQVMQEVWDKSHTRYVEKTAWIRKMLEM